MESGHGTLFVIYCLVSNWVELFSGSRIWIPGNLKYLYPLLIMLFCFGGSADKEVFSQSRIRSPVSGGYFYTGINNTNAELDFVPGVFWYGTASAIHYITMCVFSLALFYLYR